MRVKRELFVKDGNVTYTVAKNGTKWFMLDDLDRITGRPYRVG